MHQRLKERLVGAAVLVVLAVIFIPMILTGPVDKNGIKESNIPERPDKQLDSKLIPINDTAHTNKIDIVGSDETDIDPVNNDLEPGDQDRVDAIEALSASDEVAATAEEAQTPEVKKSTTGTSPQTESKEKTVGLSAWVIQLGSFSSKVNADKLNLTLRKSGFPSFVEPLNQDGKAVYRVRVGPELLRSDADQLLQEIKSKMELDGIVLRYP